MMVGGVGAGMTLTFAVLNASPTPRFWKLLGVVGTTWAWAVAAIVPMRADTRTVNRGRVARHGFVVGLMGDSLSEGEGGGNGEVAGME